MELPYETVDVFTTTRFGGNPLAVVLDADALSAAQMQSIAREFNYSETTFVLRPEGEGTHRVRIFTPSFEMPFAGHPNVGTGFVLANRNAAAERFGFEEIAGLVPITVSRDGDAVREVGIVAPQPLETGSSGTVDEVAALLGLDPERIVTETHAPCTASVGAAFTIIELASREALGDVKVEDRAALARLGGMDAVYCYTRDRGTDEADISARMIFDAGGLTEDPATGSATAACAALLHGLTGETGLVFAQGVDMGRPSRIVTRVEDDGVHVSGTCVPVMRGTLTV